jgi:hypothetical protein
VVDQSYGNEEEAERFFSFFFFHYRKRNRLYISVNGSEVSESGGRGEWIGGVPNWLLVLIKNLT